MFKKLALSVTAAALLAGSLSYAQQNDAAAYPNRAVKVIVTVPAGGGVDTVTRIVTERLQNRWGQPVVIENRGGGGGNIGAEATFISDPDGYTLMASQPAPLTTNVLLHKKINFDPTALEPVVIMSHIPNVLLVRPDFPAKTAQEFIAYVKANPDKVNYASQGVGTTSHLTSELFATLTGTKLVHVPYRGTAPALNDLIAGHVDLIFMELASAKKLHDGGRARILATATAQRLQEMPEVPTMIEAGVPGFVSDTWNAISAPPKTPKAIIAKINAAVNEILSDAEVKERYEALHLTVGGGSAEEMGAFLKEETKRWGDVIRAANIPQN